MCLRACIQVQPLTFVFISNCWIAKGVSSFKGISDLLTKKLTYVKKHKIKLVLSVLTKNEMKIFGRGMVDASNKKIIIGNLGDHRIAMCAFLLATLTNAKTYIKILKQCSLHRLLF